MTLEHRTINSRRVDQFGPMVHHRFSWLDKPHWVVDAVVSNGDIVGRRAKIELSGPALLTDLEEDIRSRLGRHALILTVNAPRPESEEEQLETCRDFAALVFACADKTIQSALAAESADRSVDTNNRLTTVQDVPA